MGWHEQNIDSDLISSVQGILAEKIQIAFNVVDTIKYIDGNKYKSLSFKDDSIVRKSGAKMDLSTLTKVNPTKVETTKNGEIVTFSDGSSIKLTKSSFGFYELEPIRSK